ncbi:MAG TPA: hypothetical protein VK766_07625 [Cytophagaceae bacterium]|nr:hypothetical protein [Cytophagaceae bacterium]
MIIRSGYGQDVRLKIDEERKNVWYFDKKGLELSEKFIKQDKNYYVGYMYEGSYKYNRATDYFGYKNAIQPLEKALKLIEKDYNYKLKTRTSDLLTFIGIYQYQVDFSWISYLLYECYSNIENPNEAMRVLRNVKNKREQKDFYCSPYVNMTWVTHRNRFHTSEKYPFLKNTIEANESMGLKYLDSAYKRIQDNYYLNSSIFNPGHEQADMRNVYFLKTLIYSYNFEIDSAEYYYDLLKDTPSFSNNNYAYTKLMNGEFKEAMRYFNLQKKEETFAEKNTKEFYYMSALLTIYQGKPETGITDLKDIISKLGSTPGFGWNNLGLSRGYYFNGQSFESQKHLEKASGFEEMHIGTTWAPEQYDFTKNIFSYLNKERKVTSIPFENKNYWYNLPTLLKLSGFFVEEQTDKFLLVNKFGANPERDYVYYHLFSPENTITFDEIWEIIDGLDADFFIRKFSDYLNDDARENIKRYYRYFIARLLINKGEYEQAELFLQEALNDPEIDADYEKLFKARCYEALCIIDKKKDLKTEYKNNLLTFYTLYPQLVPFSGNTMTFNIRIISPSENEEVKKILEELYNCKINFLSEKNPDLDFPTATISFEKVDDVWQIDCKVTDKDGQLIAHQPGFKIDEIKGSGKRIAYYLFNIPASTVPDYGENNYWLIGGVLLAIVLLWTAHRVKKSLQF